MNEAEKRLWAERVVRAVNLAFPDEIDLETWHRYQRCIPHAQACIELIKHWNLTLPEAARLLDQTGYCLGYHLQERSQYAQAEALCEEALKIRKQTLGETHHYVATSLYHIASLYHAQGKDAQAMFLHRSEKIWFMALDECKITLGLQHIRAAHIQRDLARLYVDLEDYSKAESSYKEALEIYQLDPEHSHFVAHIYNELPNSTMNRANMNLQSRFIETH